MAITHSTDIGRFGRSRISTEPGRLWLWGLIILTALIVVPPMLFLVEESFTVEAGGEAHDAFYARTFADVAEGGLLLYLDSSGSAALAVNRGSAAESLGLGPGDELVLQGA